MVPNIGVSDANREGVCRIRNVLLADEVVLSTRTRNYHWNVIGPQFYALHLLFEKQYTEIDDFIDDVAERVVDAVRTNTFYIRTHPELDAAIATRFSEIVETKPPTITVIG